uniref:Truncated cyclin-dependent kinase inhibitor 1B n=1 Tax=Homo sapiens TaxID=9606 RepID=A7KMP4_HUMAN|nr:truncated cyclin-dependent kinase inhibitor 1B [Homo sapiens]
MSNVRVSNGSPSLERMDARQAEHPKPGGAPQALGLQEPLRPGGPRRVNPGLGEALQRHGRGEPAQVEFRFSESQTPRGQVRVARGGEGQLARVLLQTPAAPQRCLQGAGAGEPGCQREPPGGAFNWGSG